MVDLVYNQYEGFINYQELARTRYTQLFPVGEEEQPIEISCVGAVQSTFFAVALDGQIEEAEYEALTDIIIDGRSYKFSEFFPDDEEIQVMYLGVMEIPFPMGDGFFVQSVYEFLNLSANPKRIEMKTSTDHAKLYMWENPTAIEIDGETRKHVGACLSTQSLITCDGAGNRVNFILTYDQYALDHMEEITNTGTILVDGDILVNGMSDLSDLGLEVLQDGNVEYPFPIAEGFTNIDGAYFIRNQGSQDRRIEINLNTEHGKIYMWNNSTATDLSQGQDIHKGVCLSVAV